MLPFFHGLKTTTGLASIFSAVYTRATNNPFVSVQIVDIVNKKQRRFTQRPNSRVIQRYGHSSSANCTTITESKDKTRVVVGYGSKVAVLNKTTGVLIREFDLNGFIPLEQGRGCEPKLSADNAELFVALDASPWYQIFDVATGNDISSQLELAYRPTARLAAFDYSENGQVIALAHTDSKGLAIYYTGPLVPIGFDPYDFGLIQPPATGALPLTADCSFSKNNIYFALSSNAPNALRVYNAADWTLTKTVQPETNWQPCAVALSEDSSRIALARNNTVGINAIYLTGPNVGATVEGITSNSLDMLDGLFVSSRSCLKFCQNDVVLGYSRSGGFLGFVEMFPGYPVISTSTDPGVVATPQQPMVTSFIEGLTNNYHCAYQFQALANSVGNGFREFSYSSEEIFSYFHSNHAFALNGFAERFISLSNDKTVAIYPLRTSPARKQRYVSTNAQTGQILSVLTLPASTPLLASDGSSLLWTSLKISPNNQHCVGKFLQDNTGAQVRQVSSLNTVVTNLPVPSFVTNPRLYRNAQYSLDGNLLIVNWGGAGNLTVDPSQSGISVHDVLNNYSIISEINILNSIVFYFEISSVNNNILVTLKENSLEQIRLYNITGSLLYQTSDRAVDYIASFIENASSFIYQKSNVGGTRVLASSPYTQSSYNSTVTNELRTHSRSWDLSQIDPLNRYIGTNFEVYDSLNLTLPSLRTIPTNNPRGVTGVVLNPGSMRV